MKRKLLTLAAILLASTFLLSATAETSPYDPWYDFDDDGDIDIFDAVGLAGRYGTTGIPINKTALLLELLSKVDLLNTTVLSLQEELATAESEMVQMNGTIEELETKLAVLNASYTKLLNMVGNHTNRINQMNATINDLISRVEALESMNCINGSITIGSPTLVWYLGSDGTCEGGSIVGNTAIIDLDVEQYIPVNFTEVFFLRNEHPTTTYRITVYMDVVVLGTDFDEAKMHIYENNTASPAWTYVGTIDLTDGSDTYTGFLAPGNYTRMSFEINATASANGKKPFRIIVDPS